MNQLAVAISVVLLPGLMASVICDKITVHCQRWDFFKYGIYSFLFGLLAYGGLQLVVDVLDFFDRYLPGLKISDTATLSVWNLVSHEGIPIKLAEVAWATFLAPLVAAAAAVIVNLKLINKAAQKLRISRKYGDENLFSFFLNADGVEWVYVRDKTAEVTYCGRVVSFSEASGMQELVLSDVDVFDLETSNHIYSVSSIYLVKPIGNFVIEVPTHLEEDASNEQEANNGRIHARDTEDAEPLAQCGRHQKADGGKSPAASAAVEEAG